MSSDAKRVDFVTLLVQRDDCVLVDVVWRDNVEFRKPIELQPAKQSIKQLSTLL